MKGAGWRLSKDGGWGIMMDDRVVKLPLLCFCRTCENITVGKETKLGETASW